MLPSIANRHAGCIIIESLHELYDDTHVVILDDVSRCVSNCHRLRTEKRGGMLSRNSL